MVERTEERNIKRRKDPRSVNLVSITPPHPLGVKPLGNNLLNPDTDIRASSLGLLAMFNDDLIVSLLHYLDITTLKNIMYTSKALYCFMNEEIWRKLYNQQDFKDFQWKGSWKKSLTGHNDIAINITINSDVIYRPFQVSNIDYLELFSNLIDDEQNNKLRALNPVGRVPRYKSDDVTLLVSPFILVDEPVPTWSLNELVKRFSNVVFTQESVRWDLGTFSEYLQNNHDELPLYLFDCRLEAMTELRKQYKVPELFQKDYFKVLGPNRPDHSWVIIGGKRSGSTFHKDPNNTSAWNMNVTGKKLWIMLPPNTTPPGVMVDSDESEVTSPIGVGEWLLSGFYHDVLKLPDALIGITFPGEIMYVPSNWWHLVINLDDSIAITENFVPDGKLTRVLKFFKDKPSQISGFKLKDIDEMIDRLSVKTDEVTQFQEKLRVGNYDLFEDCGELTDLPEIPIFEIFKQLLIDNGFKHELDERLQEMNKSWTNLTKETSSGFKFNFEE